MNCRTTFAVLAALFSICTLAWADEPRSISADQFAALHKLIRRGPGESRWMEIDWHPSVWEARQKAAAEGKPLFIWAGSGGAPSAGC
jgi:hypothetical protein